MSRLPAALCAAFLLFAVAPVAGAQSDVIRGRVTGPDSLPVENVVVTATSISGNVNRTARTDKNGRFTITFPGGDGDYMVSMAALGYAAKRFEVKRIADEDILVADARLQKVNAVLDAVTVQGQRDRVRRNDNAPDPSGTEKTVATAEVPANLMGDLAAMAATLPGVQPATNEDGSSGYSVLGLGADQNNATLNGMMFGGANLPRDAAVSTSLVTSPYDVSRGGFSGAQLSLRTRPGSNFVTRTNSLNFDSPALQWTDAAVRSLGQEYTNASLGGLVSGPLVYDKMFYNVSYQLGRRMNDYQTLLSADALGLKASGISTFARDTLLGIMAQQQIPTRCADIPRGPHRRQRARLRQHRPYVTHGDERSFGECLLQRRLGKTESGRRLGDGRPGVRGRPLQLALWRSGTSQQLLRRRHSHGDVLRRRRVEELRNALPRPSRGPGARELHVRRRHQRRADAVLWRQSRDEHHAEHDDYSVQNQLSWFSANNKHRLKLTSDLRHESSDQLLAINTLGTFSYNSLADFQANTPASFTRQLSPRQRNVDQIVGGVSLGDSYRRTSNLQLVYGLRLDGGQYLSAPALNPALDTLFSIRNNHVPNKLYVSPRAGFTWSYGTAAQIGSFLGAFRGPRGT